MASNTKVNRTFRIDGSMSIDGDTVAFIQGISITITADSFQRDFIGDGTSIFTQNGDIIGKFSFNLRNTVDMYDSAATATDTSTVSYWMQQIASLSPPSVVFIQNYVAGDDAASGNTIARITFTGRIMTPVISNSVDDALEDIEVEGEIITLTGVQRVS